MLKRCTLCLPEDILGMAARLLVGVHLQLSKAYYSLQNFLESGLGHQPCDTQLSYGLPCADDIEAPTEAMDHDTPG